MKDNQVSDSSYLTASQVRERDRVKHQSRVSRLVLGKKERAPLVKEIVDKLLDAHVTFCEIEIILQEAKDIIQNCCFPSGSRSMSKTSCESE